jgi:hypothetical protein
MGISFLMYIFLTYAHFFRNTTGVQNKYLAYTQKKHAQIHAAEQRKFALGLILNYSTPDKVVWISLLTSMHSEKEYELMHLSKHISQPLKNINMELINTPVMYVEWISHFNHQTELQSELQTKLSISDHSCQSPHPILQYYVIAVTCH